MDYSTMNFRDFINQEQPHKLVETVNEEPELEETVEPEEVTEEEEEMYQEPINRRVNRVPQYEEPEEDEYYEEDDYYEEPVPQRRPVRQVPRQTSRPQYRPTPRPVARPVKRPVSRPGYAMPEEQFRRPINITKNQLKETTIEGTANSLTEAIKRKVDTVFYRFGIQGLEKLDEKILDTIEELQYPEQKQVKRPARDMRRVPQRKQIKKPKPMQLEDITPVPVYEPEPEEIFEKQLPIPEEVYIEDETVEQEPIEEEFVDETVEEPVEEPVVQEPAPKPVKASPKPSFMKPQQPLTTKANTEELSGDDDDDLITAALHMDFNEKLEEEKHEAVSDDEMWNTVEAILESQPSQELVHEPQGTSVLPVQPQPINDTPVEENVQETPANTSTDEIVEPPKPKRKRKSKTTDEVEEPEN